MATNLAIDDNLIDEARKLGGQRTKKAVVTEALTEYIQRHKQIEILNFLERLISTLTMTIRNSAM